MTWYQEVRKAYQQGKILKVSEIANLIFADEARDGKVIIEKETNIENNILFVECSFYPNTGASEERVSYQLDLDQDFARKVVYKKIYTRVENNEFTP